MTWGGWSRFLQSNSHTPFSKIVDINQDDVQRIETDTRIISRDIAYQGSTWDAALIRNNNRYDPMVYLIKMAAPAQLARTTFVDPQRFACSLEKQMVEPGLADIIVGYGLAPGCDPSWWLERAYLDDALGSLGRISEYKHERSTRPMLRPVAHIDRLLDAFGDGGRILPHQTAFALHDLCFLQAGGHDTSDLTQDHWWVFKGTHLIDDNANFSGLVRDGGRQRLRRYVEGLMDLDVKHDGGFATRTKPNKNDVRGR